MESKGEYCGCGHQESTAPQPGRPSRATNLSWGEVRSGFIGFLFPLHSVHDSSWASLKLAPAFRLFPRIRPDASDRCNNLINPLLFNPSQVISFTEIQCRFLRPFCGTGTGRLFGNERRCACGRVCESLFDRWTEPNYCLTHSLELGGH